jgi:cation:H+ antiporter
MLLAILAIVIGFALLVWSADRFIDGAAATAKHVGMPSLVIGMVIVGFGTSAPEMFVSGLAAMGGNPALALGNAVGSNITNTGLILGITAMLAPITVHSKIVRRELPLLLLIGVVFGIFIWDKALLRWESVMLILGFLGLVAWTIIQALSNGRDPLAAEVENELQRHPMSLQTAIIWLLVGLVLLILSSQILVWGAVTIAATLGVSDLIIGLTIVALGTSLPELAASVMAVRKQEHDIAIGNVVGSNMFNILAVVGIAGSIKPMPDVAAEVLVRDWPVMMIMTVALFVMAYGFRGEGRINRIEGLALLLAYCTYTLYLIFSVALARS